jgi:hypothetical protein
MTIELDKEDRIDCMRNEHAKERERLIQGQVPPREKESKKVVEVSCYGKLGRNFLPTEITTGHR